VARRTEEAPSILRPDPEMKFIVKDDKAPEQKRQEQVESEGVQDELYHARADGKRILDAVFGALAPRFLSVQSVSEIYE
jgi:hypothetical protein